MLAHIIILSLPQTHGQQIEAAGQLPPNLPRSARPSAILAVSDSPAFAKCRPLRSRFGIRLCFAGAVEFVQVILRRARRTSGQRCAD
jgi:hypothetical protein